MIEAELPDGRILEFPDETDPSVIDSVVKRELGVEEQQEMQTLSPETEIVQRNLDKAQQAAKLLEDALGIPANLSAPAIENLIAPAEAVTGVGTAAVGEVAGGLAGIKDVVTGGTGVDAINETRESLTVQPTTEKGRGVLQAAGTVLEPVATVASAISNTIGDFVFDKTGSPGLAAAAKATPTLIAELVGLGVLNKVSKGTRLLKNGRPTPALNKVLDDQGLSFDNLSDATKRSIPEFADDKMFAFGKGPKSNAEQALIDQIKSGSRENALAPLKLEGGRVVRDKVAANAIKQGFEEGTVQMIKTATPETRKEMLKMAQTMRRVKKNDSLLTQGVRPSNVVGDALTKRIKFIRDKANDARKELNQIARNDLAGKKLDPTPVANRLTESLDNLDVTLREGANGVPIPDFAGSIISKDRASQRVIKDLIDLMAEGGAPDALRFHKLKRQLDNIIDFKKKSAGGLSDAGRNVLKDIRAELNNSLRTASDDYARVNDTLSEALTTFDQLDNATGSIDIFGESSNRALGQEMRKLMSNYRNRVNLEDALQSIEETTKNFGGEFNDSITDLASFSNRLDERFGAAAKTSFQAEIDKGVNRAINEGTRGVIREGVERGAKFTSDKLRGVNEFNAFESLESLLNTAE